MQKHIELISNVRNQYLVFSWISIVIVVLTGILYARNAPIFQAFLGKLNPLIAIFIVIFLGIILLTFLQSRGWFEISKTGNFKGLFVASGLAMMMSLAMILVDLKAVFPGYQQALSGFIVLLSGFWVHR